MSMPRRLRGVTAILAASLATVAAALPVAGDGHGAVPDIFADCVGDASAPEFARQVLEGQGLSPEMIDEAMVFACSMGALSSQDADGGLTLEAILSGEEVPDGLGGIAYDSIPDIDEQTVSAGGLQVTFIEDILKAQGMAPEEVEQIVSMYEQMGLVGEDGELMTENVSLNFLEEMLGGEQSDAGGGLTLEAISDIYAEQAMIGEVAKPGSHAEPTADDAALVDPAGTVEAAVAAAAAQRGIDPATLQQMTLEDILGLLAEE